MIKKNPLLAAGSLIGTIIGAGVFGIPYVMAKSGILVAIFYFLTLGTVVLLLHLFLGEVVLRTKEKHRLPGYTEKYLGGKMRYLVSVSILVGTVGALLAYIILGGKFLSIIFPDALSSFQFGVIVWGLLSLFVYLGIRSIARAELLMNSFLFLIFLLIFVLSFPKISPSNFSLADNNYFFLPFGIIFFSLIGWNAIPEIERILIRKEKLKKVIFWGVIIPAVFYFIFGLVVSGVSGPATSREAFQGLSSFLGRKIIVLGGIFGLLAIATSFLVLANYLKNTLIFDYRLPHIPAFLLASLLPIALFLAGARNFLEVVALVGAFVGLIEGTTISLIFQKAKKLGEKKPAFDLKVPRFLIYFIIAVLALGALSQIVYYLS